MLKGQHGGDLITLDSFNVAVATPAAFDGATSNARGDKDGTNAAFRLFTVAGDVIVRVYGVILLTPVGAATIEVGVAGNTAELLAQVANATTMATDEIWVDSTVDDVLAAIFSDVKASTLIVSGAHIIETVASADITAGNIRYVALWRPLTSDGKVTGISAA